MITRDELRAIVARKDEDDRRHAAWESGRTAHNQLLLDRDALVGLLRKVASYDSRLECEGRVICILCGAEGGCDSDCPAPVLEVLRGG